MRETKTIEFKEAVTKTFLKTVSAYANYHTGKIVFGLNDYGESIGIQNIQDTCLDIENLINGNIDPKPDYTIEINDKENTITLLVHQGLDKPYLYKAKAYKRNDTSTIEVSRLELTRLILEGQNRSYEQLPAFNQNLTFHILEKHLQDELHIEKISMDILKTFELFNDKDGYNIAAELLADENKYYGIDIVRFGENINIMYDRKTLNKQSILSQFDQAIEMYKTYYQYEEVIGSTRKVIERIPEKAFREAIANALVHRTWDINSHIKVSMYPDSIEIISPGGLPSDISEKEYLSSNISILRNPIIGNVFFRLHIIELFGTGIKRINETYKNSKTKPTFQISDNFIKITLPIQKQENNLSDDENKILELLKHKRRSSSEIKQLTNFGKTKTVALLNKLKDDGYIQIIGNGRGTKYTLL